MDMRGKNVIVKTPITYSNGQDAQPGIVTHDWAPSTEVAPSKCVNVKVFCDCGPVIDVTSVYLYPTMEAALMANPGYCCWLA